MVRLTRRDLGAATLAAPFVLSGVAKAQAGGGTLRIALGANLRTLDPAKTTTGEEYIYDKNGRLDNASFLDYRIPVASDMPMIDTVIIEVPNEKHPQGVRGVGEVPIVPPLAAVANAVQRAIGHRFTYQEWMTRDIANALMHHGSARGAACVIEAEQLCLLLGEDRRGDERVVTQAFSGAFEQSAQARNEFFRAIQSGKA